MISEYGDPTIFQVGSTSKALTMSMILPDARSALCHMLAQRSLTNGSNIRLVYLFGGVTSVVGPSQFVCYMRPYQPYSCSTNVEEPTQMGHYLRLWCFQNKSSIVCQSVKRSSAGNYKASYSGGRQNGQDPERNSKKWLQSLKSDRRFDTFVGSSSLCKVSIVVSKTSKRSRRWN